jgi:hypothetical protein
MIFDLATQARIEFACQVRIEFNDHFIAFHIQTPPRGLH